MRKREFKELHAGKGNHADSDSSDLNTETDDPMNGAFECTENGCSPNSCACCAKNSCKPFKDQWEARAEVSEPGRKYSNGYENLMQIFVFELIVEDDTGSV